MSDDGWFVQVIRPAEWPEHVADRHLLEAKSHLADKLLEKLGDGQPYVFQLRETRESRPNFMMPGARDEVIALRVDVTAVQTRRYVVPELPDYSAMPFRALSVSAWGEIKRRLRHKWNNMTWRASELVRGLSRKQLRR